ncbi:MAG: Gfo/Idh/MocA family oxidoreductase [Candidatus Acidiferrales bacterium]
MTINTSSRRDFLKIAGAGLAGTALATRASSYARIIGANDRVGVGIVGYSDRFRSSLMPAFHESSDELNFEFVGVSDIWSMRRDQAQAGVLKLTGKQIFAARNNEELYAHKEVDAVFAATADFQHAYHGTEAVHAGRDAYVEKPTAHTMEAAKMFHSAVKSSDRIVAVGTQRRSSPVYQKAHDFIQSGQFGDIVCVEMTWNVNQPGRWRRPSVVPLLKEEDTDWARYQAPLHPETLTPFDARKYLEFRLFWPYSSGIPDQWLVHQIDTVHWFSGFPHPRSVVANGGIYVWKDGRKNWDTMTAVFDYGPLDDPTKGFQVIYSSRMTNSAGDVKEIYRSNGGTLDLVTNKITSDGGLTARSAAEMNMQANLLPTVSLTDDPAQGASTAADTGDDKMTLANVRNWMECVRSRKTPNASIDAGYSHSIALCMNVAAIQTGKRVTFDDAKQEVVVGA